MSTAGAPVVVALVADGVGAGVIAAHLQGAGIEARIVEPARLGAGFASRASGRVPVVVPAGSAEAARTLLAAELDDVAWDEVDVGERLDALPLRRPGRIPALAWVGALVVAVMLLMMLALFVAALVGP